MSKYSSAMGDPLDMLVEECAEIIKECMKCRRFGPDGVKEWVEAGNSPPKLNIIKELGDLMEIVDVMITRGTIGITVDNLLEAQKQKRRRLKALFHD